MALAKPTTPQAARSSAATSGARVPGVSTPNVRTQARNGQYQRAQVETASPARLVVLLYDGAIRFCTQGLEAMAQRDVERQNTNLIKAQRIISELMGSLKRDVGGDAAENLFRLYSYIMEQLVLANLYDRREQVETVLKLLCELRETWVEVERITMVGGDAGTPADIVAAAPLPTARPQQSATPALRLGDRSA